MWGVFDLALFLLSAPDYQKLKDYTLSHSKITENEYDAMERYEWYMDSDTMLEKGLVDEVL